MYFKFVSTTQLSQNGTLTNSIQIHTVFGMYICNLCNHWHTQRKGDTTLCFIYPVCRFLILCVADSIWGVWRRSYTLLTSGPCLSPPPRRGQDSGPRMQSLGMPSRRTMTPPKNFVPLHIRTNGINGTRNSSESPAYKNPVGQNSRQSLVNCHYSVSYKFLPT